MADLITTPDRSLLFITTGGKIAYKPAVASPLPRVSLPAALTVTEGTATTLTVSLEFPHTSAVTVNYTMVDGTAQSGLDYNATSGSVSITAGQTSTTIPVVPLTRAGTQGDRTFSVSLTSAVDGGAQTIAIIPSAGTTTVTLQDAAESASLSVAAVATVTEGSPLLFRVTSALAAPSTITFSYAAGGGTAVVGTDYPATSGSGGAITAGQTSVDIAVPTIARDGYQGARTVQLTISAASMGGSDVTITTATATGTIADSELPSGAHGYYDDLRALPEAILAVSLRAQTSSDLQHAGDIALNTLADPVSTYFTYAPGSDTYSDPQDAAKFVLPQSAAGASTPTSQQLQLDFPGGTADTDTLLLTWDWYYGPEWRTNRGGINVYKMFQFMVGGKGWWTHTVHLQRAANSGLPLPVVAYPQDSVRSGPQPTAVPAPPSRQEPWFPSGVADYNQISDNSEANAIKSGVWTRHWVEIRQLQPHTAFTEYNALYEPLYGSTLEANPNDPSGRWHMVSFWIADETSGPRALLYRTPMGYNGSPGGLGWSSLWNKFRFEMNTSQSSATRTGDIIGYARNVVLLRNYTLPTTTPTSDPLIFQRPTR